MTMNRMQALLLALGLALVGIAVARADGQVDDGPNGAGAVAGPVPAPATVKPLDVPLASSE